MIYTDLVTVPRSTLLVVAAWLVSLVVSMPPLFGLSRFLYVPEDGSCSVDWGLSASFTLAYLVIAVLSPTAVVSVCYALILKASTSTYQRQFTSLDSKPRQ